MTNTNQSPAGGDAEAREAAALEIAKYVLDDAGINNLSEDDPSGTILDVTNRSIDAYLAKITSTKPEPSRIAEIREGIEIAAIDHPYRPKEHRNERAWLQKRIDKSGPLEAADAVATSARAQPELGSFAGFLWAIYEFLVVLIKDRAYLLDHITAIEAERCLSCGVKPGKIDCDPGTSNVELRQEIESLQSERDRMREALEPFARYFDLNDCAERDDDNALEVPIRDLRRAHALVSPPGTSQSEGEE